MRSPPPIAIQTAHSVGEGSARPGAWRRTLDRIHKTRDDVPEGAWKALIADRDDVASLPEAIDSWGRERVVVGALIELPRLDMAGDRDVVLVAPTADTYARLCRFLSLRHEHPDHIDRWLGPSLGGILSPQHAPDLSGIVALVRDVGIGEILKDTGANVWWRCDRVPDDALGQGLPALALSLVGHQCAEDRRGEPIRQAVARRAGATRREGRDRTMRTGLLGADELDGVVDAFAERLGLLLAGHELLTSCSYVPSGDLHLPPSDYENAEQVLAERARAGLGWRYGLSPSPAVLSRLERELAVIGRKGFAGYILTVHDLAKGRRTCGRGSAASSLVVYLLGITNVDPIKYGLVFERFL